jgi:2,3-bisphosphoglycerate-independent phosphoglycerate mutase
MTKPVALIICDGWGINDRTDHNAIALAKTPHFDELKAKWGMTKLQTSGLQVGLPDGQMGNSEVGHMNMGAGRIVYQELTRIDKEIREWNFFRNPVMCAAIDHAAEYGTNLHLIGLLSDGGVHSSLEHMFALLNMAKARKVKRTYVHAFLDGRDVPPKSGAEFLARTEQVMQQLGHGKIATIMGRYWAMDRDKNWERTERAYRAIVEGVGNQAGSAAEAIQKSYDAGISDEFVEPVILDRTGMMRGGDAVIFLNLKSLTNPSCSRT